MLAFYLAVRIVDRFSYECKTLGIMIEFEASYLRHAIVHGLRQHCGFVVVSLDGIVVQI